MGGDVRVEAFASAEEFQLDEKADRDEITAELLEERQDEIFTQAENRLHAQKGVMQYLVRGQ